MAADETPSNQQTDTDPEASRVRSLDEMNQRMDRIEAAIARLVPGSHAEAQQRVEHRLDRGSTIEDQVNAALAKRDKDAADAQAASEREAADKAEKESVSQRLAKLEERPPAPPARRSTRLLGWGS